MKSHQITLPCTALYCTPIFYRQVLRRGAEGVQSELALALSRREDVGVSGRQCPLLSLLLFFFPTSDSSFFIFFFLPLFFFFPLFIFFTTIQSSQRTPRVSLLPSSSYFSKFDQKVLLRHPFKCLFSSGNPLDRGFWVFPI